MTTAQQLKITKFPFEIKDSNNNKIYSENSNGYWCKREFDINNNQIYYENSAGDIIHSHNNKIYYYENTMVI